MSKLPRPFKEWTTYDGHVGIDYPYKDNTMVKASGNGVVTFSGYFSKKGGYGVSVQYDNGQLQSYKHSDKNDWRIASGSRVAFGTNLMEIGGTGEGSTGPHLHHEVFINGVIQKGDNYWKYVDKSENSYVGAPSSAGKESEYDMSGPWIANVKNGQKFYLIQNVKGQPTGTLLAAGSGARESTMPILNFPDDWALEQLKKDTVLLN